jgi:hypothetical protein
MADLMDGFEGSRKPSRNNGPETNRNHAETSMKPSETKVAGHRRNRETAPLKGAVAGFAARAARGSAAGPRAQMVGLSSAGPSAWSAISQPKLCFWVTGWTKTIAGGEFVSVLVRYAAGHPSLRSKRRKLRSRFMSTTPMESRSSAARTRRHRQRRRLGTRCVMVDVNQGELDALVVRGYLPEEERDDGAALKKAVEAVLSDIEMDLQAETAERSRSRV